MTLYASNPPDAAAHNPAHAVAVPSDDRSDRQPVSPTHQAVIDWLADHPDLLVKYSDGDNWWMTDQARQEVALAWFVLIEDRHERGITITPAGRRIGNRYTELATPTVITNAVAGFADGTLFDHLLTEAVHNALAAVQEARGAAVPTHRAGRSLARAALRGIRRRLAGWSR